MQSSTRLIEEQLHHNEEAKNTITEALQESLPMDLIRLANSYLMPISYEVQRLYLKKQADSKESDAYDKQIADYCLQCLFEDKPNGVANALSDLSHADQTLLLQAWEKRKADHNKYALLIAYYQHTSELKNNMNDLTARVNEAVDNALIPPSLVHALKIKIAVANNHKNRFRELLAESSLHINLKGAHFDGYYFSRTNDPRLLNWQGFNLEDTTFSSCSFYDVDFTGANFNNADLRGARFLYGCVIGNSHMNKTKNLISAYDFCDRADSLFNDFVKAGAMNTVIDGEFDEDHATFRISNGSLLHYHYGHKNKRYRKIRFFSFSWNYEEFFKLQDNPFYFSDHDRLHHLLNNGVNINHANQAGEKPIILAAKYRDKWGFNRLLYHPTAIITEDDLRCLKKIYSDQTKRFLKTSLKCMTALACCTGIAISSAYVYIAALLPFILSHPPLALALLAGFIANPLLILIGIATSLLALSLLIDTIKILPKACLYTHLFNRNYYQPALTQFQVAAKKPVKEKPLLLPIQESAIQPRPIISGKLFQPAAMTATTPSHSSIPTARRPS